MVTDDDAYEQHRDRRETFGRRVDNGDADRNRRWTAIEKLESEWMKQIMTELWPW